MLSFVTDWANFVKLLRTYETRKQLPPRKTLDVTWTVHVSFYLKRLASNTFMSLLCGLIRRVLFTRNVFHFLFTCIPMARSWLSTFHFDSSCPMFISCMGQIMVENDGKIILSRNHCEYYNFSFFEIDIIYFI